MKLPASRLLIHMADSIAFDPCGHLVLTVSQVADQAAFELEQMKQAAQRGDPQAHDRHYAAERMWSLALSDRRRVRMGREDQQPKGNAAHAYDI